MAALLLRSFLRGPRSSPTTAWTRMRPSATSSPPERRAAEAERGTLRFLRIIAPGVPPGSHNCGEVAVCSMAAPRPGGTPPTSCSPGGPLLRVRRDREHLQPQVEDLVQHPLELRLVLDGPAHEGGAGLVTELEVGEGSVELLAQLTGDDDRAGEAGHVWSAANPARKATTLGDNHPGDLAGGTAG